MATVDLKTPRPCQHLSQELPAPGESLGSPGASLPQGTLKNISNTGMVYSSDTLHQLRISAPKSLNKPKSSMTTSVQTQNIS